jgi:RNA polymerase sigma-70 factor (ECF subfamily)
VEPRAEDIALLEDWRGGDKSRGNLLFRRHVGSILRFFRTKVPENAEDLAQSTFLALVESREGFRGDASFRAYLFGIARNQLLMYLRSLGRARKRFDPLTWSAVDAGASPARLAAKHEQQRLVMSALQHLPVDYQIALELHYFEAMPLADIAAVVDEPLGTVKSRLSRGRGLLREKLEALAEPGELLTSAAGDLERWIASLPEAVRGQARSEN